MLDKLTNEAIRVSEGREHMVYPRRQIPEILHLTGKVGDVQKVCQFHLPPLRCTMKNSFLKCLPIGVGLPGTKREEGAGT